MNIHIGTILVAVLVFATLVTASDCFSLPIPGKRQLVKLRFENIFRWSIILYTKALKPVKVTAFIFPSVGCWYSMARNRGQSAVLTAGACLLLFAFLSRRSAVCYLSRYDCYCYYMSLLTHSKLSAKDRAHPQQR